MKIRVVRGGDGEGGVVMELENGLNATEDTAFGTVFGKLKKMLHQCEPPFILNIIIISLSQPAYILQNYDLTFSLWYFLKNNTKRIGNLSTYYNISVFLPV